MPAKPNSNKFSAANVAATKARKEECDKLTKMVNEGTKRQRVLAHHAMQYLVNP